MKNICNFEEKNNVEIFIKEALNDINFKQNVIDNFRLKYLKQYTNSGKDIYWIDKPRYITLNMYLLNDLLNLFESTISTSMKAILYLQNEMVDYHKLNNNILNKYKKNIIQHNDSYKNNSISREVNKNNLYESDKNCCKSHNNFSCHTSLSNFNNQINYNNSNLYYKLETAKNTNLSNGKLNNNSQIYRKYYITSKKKNRIIYYDNFLKYKNNTFSNNNSYKNTRKSDSFISPFRKNKSNTLQEISYNNLNLNINSNISNTEKNNIYFFNKNNNTYDNKEDKNNNIDNIKIKSPIRKILQEIAKNKKKNEKLYRNNSLNYFKTANNAIKITQNPIDSKKDNDDFQKKSKTSEKLTSQNCKLFFAEKYGNGDYNTFVKKYKNNQLDQNTIKNEFKIISKLLNEKELPKINDNSLQISNCNDLFNITQTENLSVPQQNKYIKKINKIRSTSIKTNNNSKEKKVITNDKLNKLYSPSEISKKITKINKINNIYNTNVSNKKIKLIIEKNKEPLFRFKLKKKDNAE